ncbi:hypothetical protein BDC45DRAFT_517249 [Circinella umbellata]|nr:hypothetical protein BDC45DRAFT_517249 [Circinella umbellata]
MTSIIYYKSLFAVLIIGILFTVGQVQAFNIKCGCYNDDGNLDLSITKVCCNGHGSLSGSLCTLEASFHILTDRSQCCTDNGAVGSCEY